MNYAIVFRLLGYILMIEGALLLLPAVTSLIYAEWAVMGVFLLTAAISAALGFALQAIKPRSKVFYMREGFAATSLSWIVISIVGAVPFVVAGCIPNPVDALFETPEEYLAAVNYITNVYLTPEIQTDKILLLAGSYHGPSVEAEYEFWVKAPGETEYAKISDYDTRTWVEYPTTVHGSYQFRVNARVVGSDADFERYYECYLDF